MAPTERTVHPLLIAGFQCECRETNDVFSNDTIKHSVLGKDGYRLEQTSGNRSLHLPTIWRGENFFQHDRFLQASRMRQTVTVVHPIYGTLTGRIESASVRHSDSPDSCEIDVAFIEEGTAVATLTPTMSALALVESAQVLATKSAIAICRQQFATISSSPSVVDSLRRLASTMTGRLAMITASFDRASALVSGLTDIPGEVIGACVSAAIAAAERISSMASSPANAAASIAFEFRRIRTTFDADSMYDMFRFAWDSVSATELNWRVAAFIQDDADKRQAFENSVGTPRFDDSGRYTAADETDTPVTTRELTVALDVARRYVAEVIERDRSAAAYLKLQIRTLTEQTGDELKGRGGMKTVTVSQPTSVYAICLAAGLPYGMAGRIIADNDIVNPNAITGTVVLP